VLPRLLGFDEARSVLVLALVEGTTLLDRHHRTGRPSRSVATALGGGLAALHSATSLPAARGRIEAELTPRLPDAFVLHAPGLAFYRSYASHGNVKLLRAIRRSESLFRGLDRLRSRWRLECLVHGDLRWDNVLVPPRRAAHARAVLVDWELATLGDPCWDVACVFVEHLNFWLGSAPITAHTPPEDVGARANPMLPRLRASLRAFWTAYAAGRRWAPREAARALTSAVELAAARLVQSAMEQTQGLTTLNAMAVYQVQLAANLLERPQEAAAGLLGLGQGAAPELVSAPRDRETESARP
jgi:aminoglycoside phosphotransferase (APT) family kinase protein